ncbi:MAG TPA: kynureninase [Rhodanobacteraceae bacterium]|nr:kynureninase [Rhodanobacteraceae bacterium]
MDTAVTDDAADNEWAAQADAADPLAGFRDEFLIPPHGDGQQVYLCGNSLGLQPRGVRDAVAEELDDWARLAVAGHLEARHPWLPYHGLVRDALAREVGALPGEVVAMNTLTVNLHLMMASFYQPTAERNAIVIEAGAFPSDRHAVASQIAFHGHDPATALIELAPDAPGGTLSMAAIEQALEQHGKRIALLMLPGVQYLTGQAFDLRAISELARHHGCRVGFDLAHAVGNLPLELHDCGCDFAVWCSYKYFNCGPGAVGGCFVHERHARFAGPRFAGWWGHEEATRFEMKPAFVAAEGADGWQLSNPPILSLAPLRVSLELFGRAGREALRAKSLRLTGYLRELIKRRHADVLEVLTPAADAEHGCQLSLRVKGPRGDGRSLFQHLEARGIIGDWREPDVIRVAPTPLYNRHADCLAFSEAVTDWTRSH